MVHVNCGSLAIWRVVGLSLVGMRPEPGRCESLSLPLCGYSFVTRYVYSKSTYIRSLRIWEERGERVSFLLPIG